MRRLLLSTLLAWGCSDPASSYVIVTVNRQPAVRDAERLKVTLSNEGSMRTDELELGGRDFPLTFSISAPGRMGELRIAIDALDDTGGLVGQGLGTATVEAETAEVVLDSADFVVNEQVANNQFLSDDYEAIGLQLAGLSNGTWMAVYRDDCNGGMCNVLARRFDPTGLPLMSDLAGGTGEFNVTTAVTTTGTIPAAAASGLTSLVFWDFIDDVNLTEGVACRPVDDQGGATAPQLAISSDTADVVTATGLSNGNYAVSWQTFFESQVVRSVIVRPDCTTLAAPFTVSRAAGVGVPYANRSHIAASTNGMLYTWIVEGALRVRPAQNTGVLGSELILIPATATQAVEHARAVAYGSGYAIAVRWGSVDGVGPGRIEVYRTDINGQIVGTPTRITDRSRSDFASNQAFGIAARADGALLVTWHSCETGPGSCEVYGRLMRPTGVPRGDEFVIPTARGSDQVSPSVIALSDVFVAAWNDSSGASPDPSGSAVRARIIYPRYDDADGQVGALCGSSAPAGALACVPGLACGPGSDSMQRCFPVCTPPSCPGGGTCTMVDSSTSACTF